MAALQDPKPENLPGSIRHYINGEWVDSVDGDTFDVLNPVTNEPYIKAASGKKADIEAAVAAAKKAFDEGPGPRCCPVSARGCCTRSRTSWGPAVTSSPPWSPTIPVCPSPRPWVRRAAPRRTSASSRT
ncbi:aldehyde dehydrogenase family protein [Kocuria marina]